MIAYAERLHVHGYDSLVSALANLVQQGYTDLSDILTFPELFAPFNLLFNRLRPVIGALQMPLMTLIKFCPRMVEGSGFLDVHQAQLGFRMSVTARL